MAHNVMTGVSTQVAGSCIFFVYVWRCNECVCVCVCVQTLHLSVCMCIFVSVHIVVCAVYSCMQKAEACISYACRLEPSVLGYCSEAVRALKASCL